MPYKSNSAIHWGCQLLLKLTITELYAYCIFVEYLCYKVLIFCLCGFFGGNLCKKHPNEPQNIPTDIKKNIERIACEESVYAQVVRICRKNMIENKYTGKKTKRKYLFQGQSAKSKYCFDIDIEWVEGNFSTREPQFYKRLFQTKIKDQSGIPYTIFPVPIENVK